MDKERIAPPRRRRRNRRSVPRNEIVRAQIGPSNSRGKVFISYCHRDKLLFACVRDWVLEEFEATWDTGARYAKDIHRGISDNMNSSDTIVALVTKRWLASVECRDELTRADDRFIPIVILLGEGVKRGELPHYLKEVPGYPWRNDAMEEARDWLLAAVEGSVRDGRKQADALAQLRKICADVRDSKFSDWKGNLATSLLQNLSPVVHDLLKSARVSFDVGHDSSYLRYANPLFSVARAITAVCIASISGFWTNRQYRPAAIEYLQQQSRSAGCIRRLFVFANPKEANSYRDICQAHYQSYGQKRKSGVFICSEASYRSMLKCGAGESSNDALTEDFGILTIPETPRRVHATLSSKEFRVQQCPEHGEDAIKISAVERLLDHADSLAEGEMDSATGIARWSPDWPSCTHRFADVLDTVFASQSSIVRHHVLLRPQHNNDEFGAYLNTLLTLFQRKELNIRLVAINRFCEVEGRDGRYGVPLAVDRSFSHVLLLEFKDRVALKDYYEDEGHSLAREKLYCMLNPRMQKRFDRIQKIPPRQRGAEFKKIEKLMTKRNHIRRYDIDYFEPTWSIVLQPPIEFSIPST